MRTAIFKLRCDVCGTCVEVPSEDWFHPCAPPDWISLSAEWGEPAHFQSEEHDFCSEACLMAYFRARAKPSVEVVSE